jgi:prevent-host-death family protein
MTNLTKLARANRLVYMTKIIKLYDAKTQLSELVERAARGEEIVIAKGNVPKARLVPLTAKPAQRAPGGWEGSVWISDDFDAPLPAELTRAFEGESE